MYHRKRKSSVFGSNARPSCYLQAYFLTAEKLHDVFTEQPIKSSSSVFYEWGGIADYFFQTEWDTLGELTSIAGSP